jgi:predicted small lipoprotein YifL
VSAGILADISRIRIQVFFMQRFLALMLLLAVSTIGLAGCGNKGPLYLPPPPVQEISAPAAVAEEVSEKAPEDTAEETTEPEEIEAAEEPEAVEID